MISTHGASDNPRVLSPVVRRTRSPADAPLLAWGDALRATRDRRKTVRRRSAIAAAGIAIIGITTIIPPRPRLVWNASASAPVGLYYVAPAMDVAPGDMMVAWPPFQVRSLAAKRRYLPAGVPLVKRVAAIGGDDVCAAGEWIWLDGHRVSQRSVVDGGARPMPWWNGCVRLRGRQVFLLMAEHRASFDGRYFGPTAPQDIIGKVWPLWIR